MLNLLVPSGLAVEITSASLAGIGVVVPSRGVVVHARIVRRGAVRGCYIGTRGGLVVPLDIYNPRLG